ncbi:uncharacterized protein B0H18DRAFT_961465 [Fomitopsis serialis]|uniref:uncharacterized protein n=1 Tax=Fomitopsis serialis TaxID=139415 RepID=UPI0020074FD2|nr:uncharacterized protein B0H18DRAFT_961465 [Neoantrodia serialis]KAH9912021.1 hypothetical protein B0H18DRAFT_961465 [Neoantrodia serialis]
MAPVDPRVKAILARHLPAFRDVCAVTEPCPLQQAVNHITVVGLDGRNTGVLYNYCPVDEGTNACFTTISTIQADPQRVIAGQRHIRALNPPALQDRWLLMGGDREWSDFWVPECLERSEATAVVEAVVFYKDGVDPLLLPLLCRVHDTEIEVPIVQPITQQALPDLNYWQNPLGVAFYDVYDDARVTLAARAEDYALGRIALPPMCSMKAELYDAPFILPTGLPQRRCRIDARWRSTDLGFPWGRILERPQIGQPGCAVILAGTGGRNVWLSSGTGVTQRLRLSASGRLSLKTLNLYPTLNTLYHVSLLSSPCLDPILAFFNYSRLAYRRSELLLTTRGNAWWDRRSHTLRSNVQGNRAEIKLALKEILALSPPAKLGGWVLLGSMIETHLGALIPPCLRAPGRKVVVDTVIFAKDSHDPVSLPLIWEELGNEIELSFNQPLTVQFFRGLNEWKGVAQGGRTTFDFYNVYSNTFIPTAVNGTQIPFRLPFPLPHIPVFKESSVTVARHAERYSFGTQRIYPFDSMKMTFMPVDFDIVWPVDVPQGREYLHAEWRVECWGAPEGIVAIRPLIGDDGCEVRRVGGPVPEEVVAGRDVGEINAPATEDDSEVEIWEITEDGNIPIVPEVWEVVRGTGEEIPYYV